ncbi:release factor glutamine methyltransferase [Pseudochelatococcus lubricantis]|uniref:Release factor glutamine methyltransferase n=1 Tax=Pseudochelatococcus lubricantis TaxID=1538102 RepID=A0ABX0V438_9HYPH|nr:peptide chain release factor N(5)-glutamine methyltransferase [Pseudochelatococcus lubricantis]NIJ59353.1 release factor glutamine methyltransferase [Pseudochelatococcus lubricantis]
MTQPTSRAQALKRLTADLREAGIDTAALDARILLKAAANLSTADLYAWPDAPLGDAALARLAAMARRRRAREPVARILGQWEFWGLPFTLSPATLVPRPETEFVVEAAVAEHGRIAAARGDSPVTFVDLGTGSGCIAVAVAHELPAARGIAVDLAPDAARVARDNARRNGVAERLSIIAGSWGSALADSSADMILSNPPYIETLDVEGLEPDVRDYDPHLALDGGADGLDAYRQIFADARRLLRADGAVIVEFGRGQAASVADIARAQGLSARPPLADLSGIERVIVATLI